MASLFALFVACSQDQTDDLLNSQTTKIEEHGDMKSSEETTPVRFFNNSISVDIITRSDLVTDDSIGIFVLNKTTSETGHLLSTGNYADNVKYIFDGSEFIVAGDDPIVQYTNENSRQDLTYFAVYPYMEAFNPVNGAFTVEGDQRIYFDFMKNDIALSKVSTDTTKVDLSFERLMSNIQITLYRKYTNSENLYPSDINVVLENVHRTATIDFNEDSIVVGNPDSLSSINCYPLTGIENWSHNNRVFQAILPPQTLNETGNFMFIVKKGDTPLDTVNLITPTMTLLKGKQYAFKINL